MADSKAQKFGLGILIGSVLGGIAATFLSPKSGKENRELIAQKIQELKKSLEEQHIDDKVKEIYGEVTDEGKKLYVTAREEVQKKLDELKKTVDSIDKEKYTAIVEDVMKKLKTEYKTSTAKLGDLQDYFEAQWNKLTAKTEEKKKKA